MRNPPLPVTRALIWRRHIIRACGNLAARRLRHPMADFGEVRPTLVSDGIHDWVGPYASATRKPSNFELTDDERALRDLGYPLIEAPYDRQQWYSVAGEYGVFRPNRGPAFDRTAYANRLLDVRRPFAFGALFPAQRRCPQRHHAHAAILRSRHARDRHRPEAAKEPGLCLRLVAGRAEKRRAAHARKRIDCRIDRAKS